MSYRIRPMETGDVDAILEIFESAKRYMRANGNMHQWNAGYPSREIVLEDIAKNRGFVYEVDGKVHAVFTFIIGEDPTYGYIEDGAWMSDAPYGTIHRIASDGVCRDILANAMAFCKERIGNIRIDTHADNKIMQNKILECGFQRCGIIYLADGNPRIAYQWTEK